MSRFRAFWWHFLAYFGTLCYFLAFFCIILVFLAFYTVLSKIRFVVIYALFRVNFVWLHPCKCKQNCPFACLAAGEVKVADMVCMVVGQAAWGAETL